MAALAWRQWLQQIKRNGGGVARKAWQCGENNAGEKLLSGASMKWRKQWLR